MFRREIKKFLMRDTFRAKLVTVMKYGSLYVMLFRFGLC